MINKKKIVLDTNCLIVALSKRSSSHLVWECFQNEDYILCVTTEILEEYEEIITRNLSSEIAQNVVNLIIKRKNVELVNTYYHWNLISEDPDDNKFVDCAITANATYIVSNDKHFDILKSIEFPHVDVIRLNEFVRLLNSTNP